MQFDRMRRREFITLIGGAAVWPLAARAQQRERMRSIGVLNTFAADDQEGHVRVAAFVQALQPFGWTIGRNVRVEQRWGTDAANTRKNAAELVALAPDVILTNSATSMAPLLEATRTVPIVFVLVADPVGAGFVDSLARPGGNATGFIALEYGFTNQMAGATQGDCAGRDAGGGHPRSHHHGRDRHVRCHPVRGAVARDGGQSGQCGT
jgi:putative ABC transport system substrate-binding protein